MAENNEVTPWKPEDAVAQLKERIRLEFAQMIPAEQFAAMVRSVITEFTEKKERRGQSDYIRASNFELVVIAELTEATKLEVKKFLSEPEWVGQWSSDGVGRQLASQRIAELLVQHGPTILNSWLGQAVQIIIQQLSYRQ